MFHIKHYFSSFSHLNFIKRQRLLPKNIFLRLSPIQSSSLLTTSFQTPVYSKAPFQAQIFFIQSFHSTHIPHIEICSSRIFFPHPPQLISLPIHPHFFSCLDGAFPHAALPHAAVLPHDGVLPHIPHSFFPHSFPHSLIRPRKSPIKGSCKSSSKGCNMRKDKCSSMRKSSSTE